MNNANGIVAKYPELEKLSLLDLNEAVGTGKLPAAAETGLRNNAGGHWNHGFFWKIMTNPSNTNGPQGELKEAIEKQFGSVDAFKDEFNAAAAARFGSGWAWLVKKDDGSLAVTSTPNQDNPLQSSIVDVAGTPVIGLDVWEHAYYLKYQNRRPEYISAFWNVVNWEQAQSNFTGA